MSDLYDAEQDARSEARYEETDLDRGADDATSVDSSAACARHGSDYMTDDGVCLHCEAEIPDAEWGADPRDSQDDLGKPVPVESLLDEDDFAVLREEADPDAR